MILPLPEDECSICSGSESDRYMKLSHQMWTQGEFCTYKKQEPPPSVWANLLRPLTCSRQHPAPLFSMSLLDCLSWRKVHCKEPLTIQMFGAGGPCLIMKALSSLLAGTHTTGKVGQITACFLLRRTLVKRKIPPTSQTLQRSLSLSRIFMDYLHCQTFKLHRRKR